jgi:four helix bundle protein
MKDEDDSSEPKRDLRKRTKQFALRCIKLFTALPKTDEARILGKQMLRSATSVGAHYRKAKRAKSHADFISKVEGGLQELEETSYWLELLAESGIVPLQRLDDLLRESDELTAILVTIVTKTKAR